VARALLEGGPQTASALAERLGLTTTAVRRHLDALVESGDVESGETAPYGPAALRVTRGRGRPARVYALTTEGRETFAMAPGSYDDLAVDALRFLHDTGGQEAVDEFARRRVAALEARAAERIGCPTGTATPEELVEILTEEGYAASLVETPGGPAVQLCQHACPMGHVAAEFPALCDAETEAFSRLLGTHVTRLATLAHGDGVCTTLVPLPAAARTVTDAPATATDARTDRVPTTEVLA
jgi:predicted ArsR family transcriptional regulator